MPSAGKGFTHAADGSRNGVIFVVVGFQFLVHDRLDLMRGAGAEREQAEVVAQELDRMMVGRKHREFGEQRAFVGFFDVRFEGEVALALGQAENRVEDAQKLKVVRLIVFGALEDLAAGAGRAADHLFRVTDDELADGRTTDDQEFKRLPQHVHMAARSHIAGNDATENDNETNDKEH